MTYSTISRTAVALAEAGAGAGEEGVERTVYGDYPAEMEAVVNSEDEWSVRCGEGDQLKVIDFAYTSELGHVSDALKAYGGSTGIVEEIREEWVLLRHADGEAIQWPYAAVKMEKRNCQSRPSSTQRVGVGGVALWVEACHRSRSDMQQEEEARQVAGVTTPRLLAQLKEGPCDFAVLRALQSRVQFKLAPRLQPKTGGEQAGSLLQCKLASRLQSKLPACSPPVASGSLSHGAAHEQLLAKGDEQRMCMRSVCRTTRADAASSSRATDQAPHSVEMVRELALPRTVEMLRGDKGMVGLNVFRPDFFTSGPCHIWEIAPNSAAGNVGCFRVGDAILAIDGESVLNIGLQEIRSLLSGLPNSR
jgi:hypothetical protein